MEKVVLSSKHGKCVRFLLLKVQNKMSPIDAYQFTENNVYDDKTPNELFAFDSFAT